MKKFSFSLDTVLSYKEQILESLRGEHARILARVRECERDIENLENERYSYGKKLDAERAAGMPIKDIRSYSTYMDALGWKIEQKKAELAKLEIEEEKKREEVVEAKKETSSIEKLKEHKLEEYNKMVQKQEEQFIEEFVSLKMRWKN